MSRRLLSLLGKRVEVFRSDPLAFTPSGDRTMGWAWATLYARSIALGLLPEPAARPFVMVLAEHPNIFTPADIYRGLMSLCYHMSASTAQESDSLLRAFRIALGNDVIYTPEQLVDMLKALSAARIPASGAQVELRVHLFARLVAQMEEAAPAEIIEGLLVAARIGPQCFIITEDLLRKILLKVEGLHELAGSVSSALARCAMTGISLPLPETEQYMTFAYNSAITVQCGPAFQITILRALACLEKHCPNSPLFASYTSKLLEHVRQNGLLDIASPNLSQLLSVLAHRREENAELVTSIFAYLLPQLQSASSSTLVTVCRNAQHLPSTFPPRLAEAAVRRGCTLMTKETASNALVLAEGLAVVAGVSIRARHILSDALTILLENYIDTFTGADFVRFTHALALSFGVFRGHKGPERLLLSSEEVQTRRLPSAYHELPPPVIDALLTRATLLKVNFNEYLMITHNLVLLGLPPQDMQPFYERLLDGRYFGLLPVRMLALLISSINIGGGTSPALLQALTAQFTRQDGFKAYGKECELLASMREEAGLPHLPELAGRTDNRGYEYANDAGNAIGADYASADAILSEDGPPPSEEKDKLGASAAHTSAAY